MLQPTGTAANWPCRQQLLFSRRSGVPAMETAPTPVFRTFHQLCPQSIAFHIPAHRQKVVIALDRKRLESPLIQMARTSRFAMSVPALCMSQCQPADKARQLIIFLRPHHQVPVIFHQTIRQQSSPRASHRFREHRLKRNEILILRKDRHPRIRPVQHMINPTTRSCSFRSSHAENLPKLNHTVNETVPDTFCDFSFVTS